MMEKAESPLVTVAVLVYNNYQYLPDCLGSVFEQDYDNIQLIVSDDGSKGFDPVETEEIIRNTATGNIKSIFVHKMEKNGGTSRNFNYVLEHTEGKYVKYIAADDLFYDEHSLSELVTAAELENGKVVIARAPNYDMYLNCQEWTYPSDEHWGMMKGAAQTPKNFFGMMSQYCLISAPSTLFNCEFLRSYGGADERYRLIEDWPLWMKMLRSGDMFTFLNKPVVVYRSGGVSNGKANKQYAVHQIEYADVIRGECLPYPEAMGNRQQYQRAKLSERTHRFHGEMLLAKDRGAVAKLGVICRNMDLCLIEVTQKLRPFLWRLQGYKRDLLLFSIIVFTIFSITDIGGLFGISGSVEDVIQLFGVAVGGVAFLASMGLYLLMLPLRFRNALSGKSE